MIDVLADLRARDDGAADTVAAIAGSALREAVLSNGSTGADLMGDALTGNAFIHETMSAAS